MIMIAGFEFRTFQRLEFLARIESGTAGVREQQRAFGADEHRGLAGIVALVDGADLIGRMEFAIEPLDDQFIPLGHGGGGEGPGDVIGLGPGIGAAGGGLLPGFLDLGGDREGGLEFEAFPEGVEDVAADIAGPAGAEVLPGAPFDGVIDVGGEGAFGGGAEPEVPRKTGGRLLPLRAWP
jgi:hypothetical protein